MAELKRGNANPNFISIETLFKNIFLIPYYQRNYSWTKEHVNALLDSLELFYDKTDKEGETYVTNFMNYIGPIVILSGEKKEIIDGQQRITTIFLIIAFLTNSLKKLRSKFDDDSFVELEEDVSDFIKKCENLILVNKKRKAVRSMSGNENEIRLTHHNENDRIAFFKIVNQKDMDDIKKNSIVIKNYNNISNYFDNKFAELNYDWNLKEDYQKIAELLILYGENLIENTFVLNIEINDMSNAFSIFETMNNTGMSLKPFDLINGYIRNEIENLSGPEALMVKKKYTDVITKIHNDSNDLSNKYAFHWINSINNNDTSNSEVFVEIKKFIGDRKNKNFLTNVSGMVNSFEKLDGYLTDEMNYIGKLIHWLKRTKILPLYLLLTKKGYDSSSTDEIILKMIKYSIIELNLLGKSPGNFQYRIKEIMKFISISKDCVSFDEIVEGNLNVKRDFKIYSEIDIFERFSNFEILDFSLNKALLLLIFMETLEPHTHLKLNLIDGEHAFPKNPKPEFMESDVWKDLKDNEEAIAKYRDCLGNIRLMNKNTNITASNNESEKKSKIVKEKSKETDPLTSNDFNIIDYNALKPEYIEKRHGEIVDLIKEKGIFNFVNLNEEE
ncbi:DUF262 domain-containing protein [[Acholeplasma] multilocale]|uniref:DUF262 domain-containing protein n=1 Tax=[Acholeplasma] multilocale TaxID=264638 RepID=UPI0004796B50|nr:DUF262 domain-containing protein [[Acholeplasma] multilocale]